MLITRTSNFSNIKRIFDLSITREQYLSWKNGELIQDAFPQLNSDDREFLMTGCTPEEWEVIFPDEDI
jgi:hypothetical protein